MAHAGPCGVWHTAAMPAEDTDNKGVADNAKPRRETQTNAATQPKATDPKKEIGGRNGPDPTRYGDWEKAGRCIDF